MKFLTLFLEAMLATLRDLPESVQQVSLIFRGSGDDLRALFGVARKVESGDDSKAGFKARSEASHSARQKGKSSETQDRLTGGYISRPFLLTVVRIPTLLIDKVAVLLAREYAVRAGYEPAPPEPPPEPKVMGVLKFFRWFCRNESREIVDLVLADLKRDIPLMHAEGRSPRFIRLVACRHVYGTVFEISWAAMYGLLKKIAQTIGLFGRISK